MELIVLCVALVVLTAFVAMPLYRNVAPPQPPITPESARQDALEAALRDLEVDRASGLVDEATYADEQARYRSGD